MLPIPGVVEVNGLDFDVRVKGVLIEQDSAASVVGNVKVIREALVLEVIDCLLERNHVPFHRNVLFSGTFSASSRCRIPARDAEACLLEKNGWVPCCQSDTPAWEKSAFGHGHRERLGLALPALTK